MPIATDSINIDDRDLILYLSAGRSHVKTLAAIKTEFYKLRAEQIRQRRALLHYYHGATPPPPLAAQPDRARPGDTRRSSAT
jgi:hypothetical protein